MGMFGYFFYFIFKQRYACLLYIYSYFRQLDCFLHLWEMSQKQRMRAFRSAWHTSNQSTLHMLKGRGRERQRVRERERWQLATVNPLTSPPSPPPEHSWGQYWGVRQAPPTTAPSEPTGRESACGGGFLGSYLYCVVASFSAPSSSSSPLCWGIIHCPRRHAKTTN